MAVNLSPIWGAGAQLLDNSGNVLSGGKIYTYAAGTTTPAATYTSSNGITANSNPIILNSAGRVPYEIWLTDGISYKFVLKDSNDVLIATYDNLTGINSNFIAYTAQQEIQTATAGQTVFNLTTMQYQPVTNNLSVFVDGVNQYGPGAQYAYVETDATTVTFVSGLHVGASVKFTTASPVSSSSTNAENVAYDPPFTGAVGTNVEAKLAQTVSVKDFGAVGDGVADDTTAIQNALNSGAKSIVFPNTGLSNYKIVSELSVPEGVEIVGIGNPTVTAYFSAEAVVFSLGNNASIENITITGGDKSTTQSGVGPSFLYDILVNGVLLGNGASAKNVTTTGIKLGYESAESTNIHLINCSSFQTGYAAVNFYHCGQVNISDGYFYQCGGFGGVTLPSCYDFTVTGCYVYNPVSTGINPGGSAATGYNVKNGTVSGCVVEAGDCINFENGAINCSITGNTVIVHSNSSSNGVGIGVFSHSGGPVSTVAVVGNSISFVLGSYGVTFGCIDTAQYIDRVVIDSNTIVGAKVGINVGGVQVMQDCRVTNNAVGCNTGGIWIANANKLLVLNNSLTTNSAITISNYYGIAIFGTLTNSRIQGNVTTGWGTHYRQEGNCSNSFIRDYYTYPNVDAASYVVLSSSVSPTISLQQSATISGVTGDAVTCMYTPLNPMGLLALNATVNGAAASNQSSSVWMYMSSINGASTGYTDAGISVTKIAGLKHDYSTAITDCSLVGSATTKNITISAGGFNTFQINELTMF